MAGRIAAHHGKPPAASVIAIVPAAGAGRRSGTSSKALRTLRGVPVLAHVLQRLSAVAAIRSIIVVVRRSERSRVRQLIARYRLRKVEQVVLGGPTRMASVRCGLAAADARAAYLLIHDAARPLIAPRVITRAIRAARQQGAAIVAMPATDTIKVQRHGARPGRLTTLPRHTVWIAQTPQVFRSALIRRAYAAAAQAGVTVTDDAAAVERLRHRVAIVPSDAANLKITWPTDFAVAETLLNGHR